MLTRKLGALSSELLDTCGELIALVGKAAVLLAELGDVSIPLSELLLHRLTVHLKLLPENGVVVALAIELTSDNALLFRGLVA